MHPDDSKSNSNTGSEMLFRRGRWRYVKVSIFRAENRHFAQGCQASRMTDYTNAELADMYLAYGAVGCSEPSAQRFYGERYSTRRIPSYNFFASLYQRLAETSSF